MKMIALFVWILIFPFCAVYAQTQFDFRSVQSGNWNSLSTWEYYNGAAWIPALYAPAASGANQVDILNGHIISVNSSVSVDQTTVHTGAELHILSGNNLTVDDGEDDDLVVNGTLKISGVSTQYATGLKGSGKVIINGVCNWSSGGINNTDFNISAAGILNIIDSSNKMIFGGMIHNAGLILHSAPGGFVYGQNGAVINNLVGGIFQANTDCNIIYYYPWSSYSRYTFNNYGTIVKAGDGAYLEFYRGYVNNYGTIQVQSGFVNLAYYGSGTNSAEIEIAADAGFKIGSNFAWTMEEASSVTGNGTFLIEGTLTASGTEQGTSFAPGITVHLANGGISGNGKLLISGTMNWTDGDIAALDLIIEAGASMNITGTDSRRFAGGGSIQNYGTVSWAAPVGVGSSTFTNHAGATVQFPENVSLWDSGGGSSYSNFHNYGLVWKTGSGTTTSFDHIYLNNYAAVLVEQGTLYIKGSNYNVSGSGASYHVKDVLKVHNGSFATNNVSITLDGPGAQILNQNGVDLLATLATNSASGSLILMNGRNLSNNTNFTNHGLLDLGEQTYSGSGNFTLAANANIVIGSPEGISESGTSGNIQKTGTISYSPEANYTYRSMISQSSGNGLPGLVKTLSVDNPAGLELASDLQVTDALALVDGCLGGAAITLGTSPSANGSLTRQTGYVSARLTRWLAPEDTSILFPLGFGDHYRPVNLEFSTLHTAGGTLSIEFVPGYPGAAGLPLLDDGTVLEHVGRQGVWALSPGNGLEAGIYEIRILAAAYPGINDYSGLHLLRRSDMENPWLAPGTHLPTSGSNENPLLGRQGLSGFSEYGIGSDYLNFQYLAPPQNLAVTIAGQNVHLSWDIHTGASSFRIYSSLDPCAEFPGDWYLEDDNVENNFWSDPSPAASTKFFIVTAAN